MPAGRITLRLQVHLQPRATRAGIVGRHGEALKVQVHAPPVGGAANAELIALLATSLEVPRRAIRIVSGAGHRQKLVEIESPDPASCLQRLEALMSVDKAEDRH